MPQDNPLAAAKTYSAETSSLTTAFERAIFDL